MSNSKLDTNIPLLTEIIHPMLAEPISLDVPLLTDTIALNPVPQQSNSTTHYTDQPSAQTSTEPSQFEWERLGLEVKEQVLQQLQSRIDFVIEQRVRDGLADVLQTAVESMAQQIKSGLHQTLDEVIQRAVTLELAKLQKQKNQSDIFYLQPKISYT